MLGALGVLEVLGVLVSRLDGAKCARSASHRLVILVSAARRPGTFALLGGQHIGHIFHDKYTDVVKSSHVGGRARWNRIPRRFVSATFGFRASSGVGNTQKGRAYFLGAGPISLCCDVAIHMLHHTRLPFRTCTLFRAHLPSFPHTVCNASATLLPNRFRRTKETRFPTFILPHSLCIGLLSIFP